MKRRAFLKGAAASAALCACGGHALAETASKRRYFCDFSPGGFRSYGLKDAARRDWSLTWSFTGTVLDSAKKSIDVNAVLTDAFDLWHDAIPRLNFRKVTSGTPDIAVSVADLGPRNAKGEMVLARCAKDGSWIRINSHVDSLGANNATRGKAEDSLLSILAHEIGHALGLLHATTQSSLMFPFSDNQERLGTDDVAGIKALYGWAPVAPIGFGTDGTPAIVDCDGTLAMVWRGQGANRNLWIATSTDGKKWSPQRQFSDVGTLGNPGLAWDDAGKRLWMVWRGVGDDKGLYYKTSTDFFVKDNPRQTNAGKVASTHGPRIAIINRTPTMVWKGVNDDRSIYYSQYENGRFKPQTLIKGVGTESSPAICRDLGGGARLLWRGLKDDQALYTTHSTRSVNDWEPQQLLKWTIPGNGSKKGTTGNAFSLAGPALTYVGAGRGSRQVIYAAWHGWKGDDALWFSQLRKDTVDGKSVIAWSDQGIIPGATSTDGPSITMFKNELRVVWKGRNDTGIWTTTD